MTVRENKNHPPCGYVCLMIDSKKSAPHSFYCKLANLEHSGNNFLQLDCNFQCCFVTPYVARWRFKKRPTPPTNLAIEAYYQNVHLLLRKWMQLQSNLDFNTSKSHFMRFCRKRHLPFSKNS